MNEELNKQANLVLKLQSEIENLKWQIDNQRSKYCAMLEEVETECGEYKRVLKEISESKSPYMPMTYYSKIRAVLDKFIEE
jgi:hypothetical protein